MNIYLWGGTLLPPRNIILTAICIVRRLWFIWTVADTPLTSSGASNRSSSFPAKLQIETSRRLHRCAFVVYSG